MRTLFRRFPALALAGASGLAYAAGPALEATTKQATNWSAIVMFMIFVGLTMGITYWAASRTSRLPISIPLAAGSPASRTAWPLRATTCRLPRCSG